MGTAIRRAMGQLPALSPRAADPRRLEQRSVTLAALSPARRASYAALSRGLAYLFLLGSLFALASMVISSGGGFSGRAVILVAAGACSAALLWVRAERMTRWGIRLLTVVGSAATATAIYLTEGTGTSGVESLLVSRVNWFLTAGTLLA